MSYARAGPRSGREPGSLTQHPSLQASQTHRAHLLKLTIFERVGALPRRVSAV